MSTLTVRTEEAFRKAVEDKINQIRVEGPLATKLELVMRIPAASMVVAAGAAGVAIFSLATAHTEIISAPATGGISPILRFGAGGGSVVVLVALLGPGTAWALIAVGIALGGFGALKMLRSGYKISYSGSDYVVLARKS